MNTLHVCKTPGSAERNPFGHNNSKYHIMRKALFTTFIMFSLLLSGHGLYAQQRFSVGAQGGLGASSTHNDFKGGSEHTSGLELGIPKNYPVFSHMYNLYLSYRISEGYGIAFEPGFIRKGYGNKAVTEEGDVLFNRRRLDYLQLPLLLELHVGESVVLTAGPEVGYLLNAKMRTTTNSQSAVLTDLPKSNRWDLGIQVGGYYTLMRHLDVGVKAGASITRAQKFYLTNEDGEVLTSVSRRNMYAHPFIRVRW